MKISRSFAILIVSTLVVVAGLGIVLLRPRRGEGGREAAGAKEYRLVGEVRAVDESAGTVTVRHEAIPGFMPAMTMPLRPEDPELLRELRPGDAIEATLRIADGRSSLRDVEITDFAPAPSLTLNASGALVERPKLLEPGEPVPDFAMTTQAGAPLRLSDLRGRVVALTFVYTRCPLPEFCPRMDRKFGELARQVEAVPGRAEGIKLLSISFDPEHDTPAVLARHASLRGADGTTWSFAVASHDELHKVAAPLGLAYGPDQDQVLHNLVTAVIAPDGTLARVERGGDWQVADLLRTILELRRRNSKS